MKKIFNFSVLALLFMSVLSCSSDDDITIVESDSAPVLISPEDGSSIVLSPDLSDNPALTLVWDHSVYTVDTEIDYTIEMAVAETDFASPTIAGTTTTHVYSLNVEELNTVASNLELTPFESSAVEVRIVSSLGDNGDLAMISNVITINITPYTTESPKLWIPGGYQPTSGYGPDAFTHSTAPTLSAVAYGDVDFEGYMYIANDITNPDNGFKFSSQANWDGTNYGQGTADGELSSDGGAANLVADAGYYLVKVNTDALTYSLTPAEWGVVGYATTGNDDGWNNSTPMTYNIDNKVWETTITLSDGEFKFRANNAWDINLGAGGSENNLSYGGDNITATAGTYKITLDLSNPRNYTYTIELQ
ncbi:SusE domain-containing protein [Flavobacterium rakeshii]|nr:SusE domain-containing protein [Flavobacterium rakeshii]MEE1897674.1 SusE domain-containing protein [Flavobacterium rakeshii]